MLATPPSAKRKELLVHTPTMTRTNKTGGLEPHNTGTACLTHASKKKSPLDRLLCLDELFANRKVFGSKFQKYFKKMYRSGLMIVGELPTIYVLICSERSARGFDAEINKKMG